MIQKIIVYTTQHWRCFRQNKQSIKSRIKPPTTILLIGSASPWIIKCIYHPVMSYLFISSKNKKYPNPHWQPPPGSESIIVPNNDLRYPLASWLRAESGAPYPFALLRHLWRSIPPRGHIIREGWTPWGRKPQETTDWSSDHPSCQKWSFDQLVVTVIPKQLHATNLPSWAPPTPGSRAPSQSPPASRCRRWPTNSRASCRGESSHACARDSPLDILQCPKVKSQYCWAHDVLDASGFFCRWGRLTGRQE